MPTTTGIKAGRAWVELGVDSTSLERGLRVAANQIRDFGKATQKVGEVMLKAGVIGLAPLVAGAKAFADFEAHMARVQAITNATAGEFGMLGKKAQRLGLDTIFSASQAAEAMGNFAQAGLSVNQILRASGPALDLAATAHIEIAQAASIATKVMFGMGIGVKGLGRVIDVMAKAATSANTDIMMLGSAFEFVGPVAKGLGIRIEEITAAIQILSNAGIQGEMAGTALRGMLLSLASPTTEAGNMLRMLGIRVNDARGNFLGIAPIIYQLQRSLRGMGTGVKVDILGQIFPDRQTAAVVELVARGAGHLTEKTRALGKVSGTAARIAGVQMDTLRGGVERLMSSIEMVGLAVGESLNPVLRKLGDILVEVANTIALMTQNNKPFVVMVAKGVLGLIGFGGALVAVGLASKLLAFQLGALRSIFSAAMVGFKGLSIMASLVGMVFKVLSFSIPGLTIAFKTFSVVGAVVAAVMPFFTAAAVAASAAVGTLIQVFGVLIASAAGLATVAWSAGASIVGFNGALLACFSPLSAITIAVVALGAALYYTGAAGKLMSVIGGALGVLFKWLGSVVSAVASAVASGFMELATTIGDAVGAIVEGFRTLVADFKVTFGTIVDALKSGDVELAAKIFWSFLKVEWYKGIAAVSDAWQGFLLWFREAFAKGSYNVASLFITTWHWLVGAVIDGGRNIRDIVASLWDWLKSGFGGVWNFVADGITNWVARSEKSFVGLIKRLKTEFANLKGFLSAGLYDSAAAIVKINQEADDKLVAIEKRRAKAVGKRHEGADDEAKKSAAAAAARKKAREDALKETDRLHIREQTALKSDYDMKVEGYRKEAAAATNSAKANLKTAQEEQELLRIKAEAGSKAAATPELTEAEQAKAARLAAARKKLRLAAAQKESREAIKIAEEKVQAGLRSQKAVTAMGEEAGPEDAAKATRQIADAREELAKANARLAFQKQAAGGILTRGRVRKGGLPYMPTGEGGGDRLESLLGGGGGRLSLEGLGLTPGGLDRTLKQVGTSAKGTFDATALSGMGIGEEMGEKQLKEAKKQTELLGSINNNTGKGGVVFAG